MSEKNELKPNQQRALTAIMESATLGAAAQAAGLNERTLYRYLQDPVFRAELSRREGLIMDLVTRRLLQMSSKALDALEDVLDAPFHRGAGNMRLAAKTVIDSLLKIREMVTTEQRLADLEAAVYGNNKGKD